MASSLTARVLRHCSRSTSSLRTAAIATQHLQPRRTQSTAPAASILTHSDRPVTSSVLKPININGIKANGKTRRFYTHVDVIDVATLQNTPHTYSAAIPTNGYCISLHGRLLTTASERLFVVPSEQLAAAIAYEWDNQHERVMPDSMPLTHICMIANDQALLNRDWFVNSFTNYLKFDAVCIRATYPPPLIRLQRATHDPLIAHMQHTWNLPLITSAGIMAPQQSTAAYDSMSYLLAQQDAFGLAALDTMASVSKSFTVAWLLYTNTISINTAYSTARLDEDWQIEHYGEVTGAFGHGVEKTYVKMKLAAAKTIVSMLQLQPQEHTYSIGNSNSSSSSSSSSSSTQ